MVVVVLGAASATAVRAQAPDLAFDFVFDLGAPGVQTFHQDRDGFLWIGTKGNGLFRYDGYELKHYSVGPGGLSNGYIYGLVEDPLDPDILWIGTKGGLNRLDRRTGTYTYYQHDPGDPQSLSLDAINTILQDRQELDVLWVVSDGGLDRFDKRSGTFTRYRPVPEDPNGLLCPQVWRIVQDATDPHIFWIATWGCGLYRFDKRSGAFTQYLHDPDDPTSSGAEDGIICDVAQDKDNPNILWLGSIDDGLDKFDRRTEIFTHYPHDPDDPNSPPAGVLALIRDDGAGTLWLGGWVSNNGLTLFDKATETFTNYRHDPADPHSLSDSQITDVYQDRAGITWVVGISGKVDKYDPWNQNFTLYQHIPNDPTSLVHNAVTTLYEDREGVIWLGTQSGLSRFDPRAEIFTNYTHVPGDPSSLRGDYVWDITQAPSGDIWITHFPGPLARLDPGTGRVKASYQAGQESFTYVLQDPEDEDILWVGTRPHGFARFDKRSESFTFYAPDQIDPELGVSYSFMYVALHDAREDVIWVGGWEGGGLNRFDKRTETFIHYRADFEDPDSLATDAIAALYQDAEGTLWVGTLGGGLDKFDAATGTFTHYAEAHGVPAMVYAILQDGTGCLWLSTDSGVVKFNPATEQVEKAYRAQDGLQGDAFLQDSGLKTRAGELWFGGTNGVNRFDPDALIYNPYVPPVVLTAFTQGGEPYPPDVAPERLEEITLDWRQNFFEFEFAALNYTQPQRNRYAYQLEGMDRTWYDAGTRRFGRYTGLAPGRYVLRIRGSNNDGVWNEEGVSLAITVTPPFWQRWWFISLVAGVVVVGVGSITRAQILRLRAERAAVQAVEESEARLRHVVENMPVIMDASDAQGRLVVWNRESERVTGYTAEEMLHDPQALARLYPDPAYRQRVLAVHQQGHDDLRDFETQVTCKDGSVKVIAWSDISRRYPIPGWASWAVGLDVTERRRAEAERERLLAELEAQARQMQHVIDTVPEGVLLLDAKGRVRLANPVAERALAVLADAGVGDVVTHLGERPLYELLTSPPTRGLWHEVKVEHQMFELIARPMENGSQAENWLLVVRNVTRERQVQQRIQQQERLAAVGQLAAGIAHDFNNIMTTIALYAQMASRARALSERDRDRLDVVRNQARHASQLVQQILDFSRRAVLERRPLDLLPLLKEQVKILRRTLPESIDIVVDHEPVDYVVDADPTRMQQLLTNLALNARDAMPHGGTLRIELRRRRVVDRESAPLPGMEVGSWVALSVSDTGVGISPEVLPRIFEPFFTTKAPGEGSGLGLPQVYGIVEAHDGLIDVHSEEGQGTCITVYLPVVALQPAEVRPTAEAPALHEGQGETLLVVEDNVETRRAVVESLDLLHYHVLVAGNGREALDVLEEHRDEIALILSDVVMPEMSGVALLRALREAEIDIPVVMMTGHPLEQTLDILQEQEIVDWITKPPSLERLSIAIARGLGEE
jgi:PAS domain S-box-containing protein